VRRTRVGGDLKDGFGTVLLAEHGEAYELEMLGPDDGRLVTCLEYGGSDQHQRLVRDLPLGWGCSTSQDFNGDIGLIACFASSWTPATVRRAGTPIPAARRRFERSGSL
jgi:hypothetical protein